MNRLEIYNETMALLNSYFLYIFSQALILKPNPEYPQPYNSEIDWERDSAIHIPDFDAHYDCGWANNATLALFISVNLAIVLIGGIYSIYKRIKRAYKKKIMMQAMEMIQQNR